MDWRNYLTAEQFYNNFVADDRFVKYILGGLKTTLIITLFAVLLGIFLGFLAGTVRSTYERTVWRRSAAAWGQTGKEFGKFLLFRNKPCKIKLMKQIRDISSPQ